MFEMRRLFTSPWLNVGSDTLGWPSVELHEDGGEGGVDDEGDQEEEGKEAEGAEEDEERGRVEQQLLQERLLLLFLRHLGEQTAVLVSGMHLVDVVVFVVVVVLGVLADRRHVGRRWGETICEFVSCFTHSQPPLSTTLYRVSSDRAFSVHRHRLTRWISIGFR